MLEPEVVRKYVSLLTGKDLWPLDPDRFPTDNIRWLMYATFAKGVMETPYINMVWAEDNEDTTLHIETEPLGDTIDMTEWMYGDESLFDRGRFDLTGFERMEGRSEYAKKFPRVVGRLNSYERFASKQAAKLGTNMRLLLHGSPGIASFQLEAQFETNGMTIPLILHHIDLNVIALKQTFYEIADRQQTLYFLWAMQPNDNTQRNRRPE